MSDLSVDTDNALRHAKAFNHVSAIRKKLRAERAKVIAEYRPAVMDHSFPDVATSGSMPKEELDKLKEDLDMLQPPHQ